MKDKTGPMSDHIESRALDAAVDLDALVRCVCEMVITATRERERERQTSLLNCRTEHADRQ